MQRADESGKNNCELECRMRMSIWGDKSFHAQEFHKNEG